MDEKREYSETLRGIHERFTGHMELMRRSITRLKERTHQLSVSQDEKNGLLSEIGNIEGWLKRMEASNGFFKARLWERDVEFFNAHFSKMWTTEQDDWWLWPVQMSDGTEAYDLHQVSTNMSLIIEDDDAYEYVTQRMKEAGNHIVTSEEMADLTPEPPPGGWPAVPPVSVDDDDEDV